MLRFGSWVVAADTTNQEKSPWLEIHFDAWRQRGWTLWLGVALEMVQGALRAQVHTDRDMNVRCLTDFARAV